MSHIFISYSKQNKEYARKLTDNLLSLGFDVWIDDQIEPSEEWFKRIVKGVRECAAFLVIMTPESGASRWVEREVMLADELQKPMFPILLNGDLHTCELWALFIGKQYEDTRGEKLPGDRFYTKLALSAPRKTESPPLQGSENTAPTDVWDGWMPKFDDPASSDEKLEKTVTEFTKRHLARLRELKEHQVANPPDVSHILPSPFEWCVVPTGEVTIRFTPRAKATTSVQAFSISRYPVTNSQYQGFVDSKDGYINPVWWDFSDKAKRWRRDNPEPQFTAFRGDQLPRTNVTWYEAMAFCDWLAGQIGQKIPGVPASLTGSPRILLPTEQQWQRAAQGDDGREYPWGNFFSADYCNTVEGNIGQPSPVTHYENGESPFEVLDLAGNVWEWCLSEWGTSDINLNSEGARVVRGGSYNFDQTVASTMYRDRNLPDRSFNYQGFRIVFVTTA